MTGEEFDERLNRWKELAREADRELTGIDNPLDESFLVKNREENDRRMKYMASILPDMVLHEFYVIGVAYQAETLILGQMYREDLIYSNTILDTFSIKGVSYTVSRIGIQKIQNRPEHGNIEENTEESGQEEEAPSQGMHYAYGDTVARTIGGRQYVFRCIDEDYRDASGNYRGAALFLCDTVIRSDVDSDDGERRLLRFGADNNYRQSDVRKWLREHTKDSPFSEEPVDVGVSLAYAGSTEEDACEQLDPELLLEYPISRQRLNDPVFLLSVEEAVRYAGELWRFYGSGENNPEEVYSPFSKGYYLRSPLYEEDGEGAFCYGDGVYAVDLMAGNIHAVDVSGMTMGLRPAFALPNG